MPGPGGEGLSGPGALDAHVHPQQRPHGRVLLGPFHQRLLRQDMEGQALPGKTQMEDHPGRGDSLQEVRDIDIRGQAMGDCSNPPRII